MRLKEKKKAKKTTIVFIVLTIFLLTIGVGYSYLQQSLSISGKATVAPTVVDGYIQGNSTYCWEILDSWEDNKTNEITYRVKMNIINLDKDISTWRVSFDVPNSYNDTSSKIVTESYKTYSNNRINLVGSDANGFVSKGDTMEIEMELVIDNKEDFYINNVVLNDLLVTNRKNV